MKTRNRILSIFLAVLMLLTAAPLAGFVGLEIAPKAKALATTGQCGENVFWTFDKSTKTLTISGTGAINDAAFDYCREVSRVVIEYGVTSIGKDAFYRCTGMTSLTIPNSVTNICDHAFEGCSNLTSLMIPNSVTSIGYATFMGCSKLTSVTIPGSVISIDSGAFWKCNGLTSVVVQYGVTSISDSMFKECSSLTSVTIPNSVTSIGDEAFDVCTSLTSLTIPNSVTSIGYRAFNWCKQLPGITIPNSVTSIGNEAFKVCTSLTSLTIPNSVTSIGFGAFEDCSALESISISNRLTDIEDFLFLNCTSLTHITIPNSVASIGNRAFANCSALTNITIPESVTSICYGAFQGCTSLANIHVDINNQSYMSDENGCVYNKDKTDLVQYPIGNARTGFAIPEGVTRICPYAFTSCTLLNGVMIPNSVTEISGSAFFSCASITSLIIPKSVTVIGSHAFSGCTNLINVTISGGVKSLFLCLFSGCTNLTNVTISNGVTDIEHDVFSNCTNLTSITIPVSLTDIGFQAFNGCTSLNTVYFAGTQEQWNEIEISYGNDSLKNATVFYNSTGLDDPETTPKATAWFKTEKNQGTAEASLDITWLENSAYTYNHEIAQFCSNMALLAYSSRDQISDCLDDLGFDFKDYGFSKDDTKVNDYCYWPRKENTVYDRNSFLITRKDYKIDGEEKTLVLVLLRGTCGNEWYSDFDPWGKLVGSGTYFGKTHASFDDGARFVLSNLKSYMKREKLLNKDNVKMIVTGHSRGAAVANLLGKYINSDGANFTEKYGFPEEENVFTYTFATPKVTSENDTESNLYQTIFNFVNPEDFVTKVMLAKNWNFKRYGVTLTLPSDTNESFYPEYLTKMNQAFRQYKGRSYSPYPKGEETVYNLIESFAINVPSVNAFYNERLNYRNYLKREPYLFFQKELCPLVAQMDTTEMIEAGSSLAATFLASGSSIVYFNFIYFFFSNQLLGLLSNWSESQVEKILNDEIDIINPYFEDAHCAETYAAFLNTMTREQAYYGGQVREGYRGSVNCPVNVEIIDKKTNEVVGRIVDNVVDEDICAKDNSVVVNVNGDNKTFWLPYNGDYEVKLTGNDAGKMDYTLAEIQSDTGELGRTNFFDVSLEDGLTFTSEVDGETFTLPDYTLTAENGTEIRPDETFDSEDATKYIVTVSTDENGITEGDGTYTSGDYATVNAFPNEGYVFDGWFVNDELVSSNAAYRFRVDADITLTAHFKPCIHQYTETVATAPTCTTTGESTIACSLCGFSYTETIPALGHVDENNDGRCDACGEQMTGGDHCKFCGKIHNGGFFDKLTGFFHKIFAIFKR